MRKNHLFTRIFDLSIAKFFLLCGLILQYQNITLKYLISIINKISKKYNEQVFYKKTAFKNLATFTGKDLCCSLFFNKNAGLQSCNFIKKRLQHRRFPVNFATFLRTYVLKNICERLFERFPTWTNNIKLRQNEKNIKSWSF